MIPLTKLLTLQFKLNSAPRGPAADQCDEIYTAGSRGPAATTRAAAGPSTLQVQRALCLPRNLPSRFTKRCACHTNDSRGPAAAQRRPRAPQLFREAPCTVPATKSTLQLRRVLCLPHKRQPRPSGDHGRRSCSGRLRVLCLPRNLHSRCTDCCACHTNGSRGPAATTHAAAALGGSVR